MGSSGLGGDSDEYGQGSEKGALYDAYNLLHSLAQVSCVGLFNIDVSRMVTCKLSLRMVYVKRGVECFNWR